LTILIHPPRDHHARGTTNQRGDPVKVKQLREALKNVPDDWEIVIALDWLMDEKLEYIELPVNEAQQFDAPRELHLFTRLSTTTFQPNEVIQ